MYISANMHIKTYKIRCKRYVIREMSPKVLQLLYIQNKCNLLLKTILNLLKLTHLLTKNFEYYQKMYKSQVNNQIGH